MPTVLSGGPRGFVPLELSAWAAPPRGGVSVWLAWGWPPRKHGRKRPNCSGAPDTELVAKKAAIPKLICICFCVPHALLHICVSCRKPNKLLTNRALEPVHAPAAARHQTRTLFLSMRMDLRGKRADEAETERLCPATQLSKSRGARPYNLTPVACGRKVGPRWAQSPSITRDTSREGSQNTFS